MLIGLCGRPKSGKGEVRACLERFGFNVVDVKHPLKEAASLLTGIPYSEFESQTGKSAEFRGVKLRTIMGELGKSVEGLFGEYFLVDQAVYPLIRQGRQTREHFVVDSLRMGQTTVFEGVVVEVISDRGIDTGNDFDEYEKETVDYRLENSGTLGELETAVTVMLDQLGFVWGA